MRPRSSWRQIPKKRIHKRAPTNSACSEKMHLQRQILLRESPATPIPRATRGRPFGAPRRRWRPRSIIRRETGYWKLPACSMARRSRPAFGAPSRSNRGRISPLHPKRTLKPSAAFVPTVDFEPSGNRCPKFERFEFEQIPLGRKESRLELGEALSLDDSPAKRPRRSPRRSQARMRDKTKGIGRTRLPLHNTRGKSKVGKAKALGSLQSHTSPTHCPRPTRRGPLGRQTAMQLGFPSLFSLPQPPSILMPDVSLSIVHPVPLSRCKLFHYEILRLE